MKIMGIDLAERLSGVAVLNMDGDQVYSDFFDAGISRHPARPLEHIMIWADHFTGLVDDLLAPGDLVVIEDLHSSTTSFHVRMPLRFQGTLLTLCHLSELRSRLTLPREWRKGLGYDGTKDTRTPRVWARQMCEQLCFDLGEVKGKSKTDIRDALLIAEWARRHWDGEKVDATKSQDEQAIAS